MTDNFFSDIKIKNVKTHVREQGSADVRHMVDCDAYPFANTPGANDWSDGTMQFDDWDYDNRIVSCYIDTAAMGIRVMRSFRADHGSTPASPTRTMSRPISSRRRLTGHHHRQSVRRRRSRLCCQRADGRSPAAGSGFQIGAIGNKFGVNGAAPVVPQEANIDNVTVLCRFGFIIASTVRASRTGLNPRSSSPSITAQAGEMQSVDAVAAPVDITLPATTAPGHTFTIVAKGQPRV